MAQVGLVLLGAVFAFCASFAIERWKAMRTARAAARMLVRELEFHRTRLSMAAAGDDARAFYEMMLPAPIWNAHSSSLLSALPSADANAILDWYATLEVIGHSLARTPGPYGVEITGPDRQRLKQALDFAYASATRLAARGSSGGNQLPSGLPVFSEAGA